MKSFSGDKGVRARELLVFAALLSGIAGVTCLVVVTPAIDAPRIQPIRSALAVPRVVSQSTGPISAARPARVTNDEKWAADESARGTRSDSAH